MTGICTSDGARFEPHDSPTPITITLDHVVVSEGRVLCNIRVGGKRTIAEARKLAVDILVACDVATAHAAQNPTLPVPVGFLEAAE